MDGTNNRPFSITESVCDLEAIQYTIYNISAKNIIIIIYCLVFDNGISIFDLSFLLVNTASHVF